MTKQGLAKILRQCICSCVQYQEKYSTHYYLGIKAVEFDVVTSHVTYPFSSIMNENIKGGGEKNGEK